MKPSPFAPAQLAALPELAGVNIATCHAGIRYRERDDLMLMVFDKAATVAGVYTRSMAAAAPVEWCRNACDSGTIGALLVNSGNANAFTGQQGKDDAASMAQAVAEQVQCEAANVMISSTGVIGEFLPIDCITQAIPSLYTQSGDGCGTWEQAARAIMTTDTFPKMVTRTSTIGDKTVTINAIAKGSGMIAPDMATMLGYLVTDATLPADILQTLLSRNTTRTFNAITVDSDTSTNDTVLLIATSAISHPVPFGAGDPLLDDFRRVLHEVMRELAILVVKDGEGASKFVTIHMQGAKDSESARLAGLAVANSPLVKTAFAASDPNWGRIIAALGKSGQWVDIDAVTMHIGDVPVTQRGQRHPDYSEEQAKAHMQQPEITLSINMGVGQGSATVWTCDFTEGYIRINADYRS